MPVTTAARNAPASTPALTSLVEGALRGVLDDLADLPPLFEPLTFKLVGVNAVAELSLRWTCHPRLREPDDCETAILELLFRRGLTRANQVASILGDQFSRDTIFRRLRRLTRLGVVRKSLETPRGYVAPWLCEEGDSRESRAS